VIVGVGVGDDVGIHVGENITVGVVSDVEMGIGFTTKTTPTNTPIITKQAPIRSPNRNAVKLFIMIPEQLLHTTCLPQTHHDRSHL
jgi:hypothetical protein